MLTYALERFAPACARTGGSRRSSSEYAGYSQPAAPRRVRLRQHHRRERRRCARCWQGRAGRRRPRRPCCCAARPAPARSWSPARSTSTRRASTQPFVAVNCAALAPGAARERAVRAREGRVHRRDRATRRPLRAGRRRHAVPRRDRRAAAARCRSSCCACCRSASSSAWAARETIKVDVRVVAATNRDLEQHDRGGRVPRGPLLPAQRRSRSTCRRCASASTDHSAAGRALRRASSRASAGQAGPPALDAGALAALRELPWPGNVRELENMIERAIILARGSGSPRADLDFGRRAQPSTGRPDRRRCRRRRHPTARGRRDGWPPAAERLLEQRAQGDRRRRSKARRATSPAPRARSASTGRRCTTGCASTASSTCCR